MKHDGPNSAVTGITNVREFPPLSAKLSNDQGERLKRFPPLTARLDTWHYGIWLDVSLILFTIGK